MSHQLFINLLNGVVDIQSFQEWLSGRNVKEIDSSLNRTEVVLYVLNYVQEETNKFVNTSSSLGTPKTKATDNDCTRKAVSEPKTPEKHGTNNTKGRLPFQAVNKISPSKANRPFARYLNHGSEVRRDILNCSTEGRNLLTSTPRSGRHEFAISPSQSSNSLQSDCSSLSLTPKSSKSSRLNSSTGSYHFSPTFSPTSPHYVDSFPDLGAKPRHRTPQSPCLADFITTKPTSQKNKKRIKPTQLAPAADKDVACDSNKGSVSFGIITRPFVPIASTAQSPPEAKEKTNFEEERNLLKLKRTQCLNISEQTKFNQTQIPMMTNLVEAESNSLKQSSCSVNSTEKSPQQTISPVKPVVVIEPDPSLVSSADRVIRLASIYSTFLDENLVPNITAELYFIFNILSTVYRYRCTSDQDTNTFTKDKTSDFALQNLTLEDAPSNVNNSVETPKQMATTSKHVLNSVHNCVLFAVAVIEKQLLLVQYTDKAVTRLLLENKRVSRFAPHLIPELTRMAETMDSKEARCMPANKPVSMDNGPVLYHSETDSKDNFSTDMAFNVFKKQRDMFYKILYEWRTKHMDNQWTSKKLLVLVQNLLSLSGDPSNMMHLARLFCAQLTSVADGGSDCEPELDLPGVSKDKLSRLEARLRRPRESTAAPRPPLQFPGEQMFYQHFLQHATGSSFLTHLIDCLVHRIDVLDNTPFFVEGMGEEESRAQVSGCVSSCCVLAKFLGLVVFAPYSSSAALHPDALQAQLLVRQSVTPPVNLLSYVQRALSANRLVVTVPWIVSFLAQMDAAAPHLPCYRPTLHLLISLYRSLPLRHLKPRAAVLLRAQIGWLFDVSFFPETIFYSLATSCDLLEPQGIEPVDVDVQDTVDQKLMSELCPFLSAPRLLLSTSSTSQVHGGAPARHITPTPALVARPARANPAHTLELQLEESFLSGQTGSFRATVEFIIDRLSSSCIKHVCSNIIAPCKERAAQELTRMRQDNQKLNKNELQQFVRDQCEGSLCLIEAALSEACGTKASSVLTDLLGPDASDQRVFHMAHSICARRCRDKIVSWLNSHINLNDIFTKLTNVPDLVKINVDCDSKPGEKLLWKQDRVDHRDDVTSPPDMLNCLQDSVCTSLEQRQFPPSEGQVLHILHSTLDTIQFRSDLSSASEGILFTVSVDYAIVLLAHFPGVVTEAVLQALCDLWLKCSGSAPLESVISPRNVLLLCQAGLPHAHQSWRSLASLLTRLLTARLLTPHQLETQCVAIFRLDWPPMVLRLLGSCLSSILEQIQQDPRFNSNSKFLLMLEWVNEMTEDLAKDDYVKDD